MLSRPGTGARLGLTLAVTGFALFPGLALSAGGASAAGPECRPFRVVSFPDVGNSVGVGVSGTSSTDVWAVGRSYESPAEPVIRHWNGEGWESVPQERIDGALADVWAISPTDSWAVGYFVSKEEGVAPLAMHWDGVSWTMVDTPTPGIYGSLSGVSALSSTDVWAVGDYTAGDGSIHGLTMHWDGASWTLVQEDHTEFGEVFREVSAVSPADVWAVGYKGTPTATQPIIEQWDGTRWSVVPAPEPRVGDSNTLYDVAGISATDAWAVGSYGPLVPTDEFNPLLMRWDGSGWRSVDLPRHPYTVLLRGVSALTSEDVWAVGGTVDDVAGTDPLRLHWDGADWRAVPVRGPVPDDAFLDAVAAISSDSIWAVGNYTDAVDARPLTERSKGCGS